MIELVLPWGFLIPLRAARLAAAVGSICFMAVIAMGGNYAFLNHLTAVPMFMALDDAFLCMWLCRPCHQHCHGTWETQETLLLGTSSGAQMWWRRTKCVLVVCVSMLIGFKTCVPDQQGRSPIQNLFGQHPWLETYDDLFLVNAYGYLCVCSLNLQLIESLVGQVCKGI